MGHGLSPRRGLETHHMKAPLQKNARRVISPSKTNRSKFATPQYQSKIQKATKHPIQTLKQPFETLKTITEKTFKHQEIAKNKQQKKTIKKKTEQTEPFCHFLYKTKVPIRPRYHSRIPSTPARARTVSKMKVKRLLLPISSFFCLRRLEGAQNVLEQEVK